MPHPPLWMVRAGEGAFMIEDFLNKNIVAIGWNETGDLSDTDQLATIKAKLREALPEAKTGQINNFAGQIYRFRVEFQKGHRVLTYNPVQRTYHIGEITSAYQYNQSRAEYWHQREVNWFKEVSRDQLSTKTKNSLGSTLTIFSVSDTARQELLADKPQKQELHSVPDLEEDEILEEIKDETVNRAHEFIKDKVLQLSWEEMEELVAGILRGMGFKTMLSPKGADRGKDITASPDGLGLEDPKIKVEVKHRKGAMSAPDIRNFLGGLRSGDKGLYVSTGGFTKDATYEAERANNPLTLLNSEQLVQLIVQHYSQFDPDTRALLPLKMIYWPV